MMRLVYFLQIFETIFSPQRFSFRCSMKQCVCAFLCNATQKLLFCEIRVTQCPKPCNFRYSWTLRGFWLSLDTCGFCFKISTLLFDIIPWTVSYNWIFLATLCNLLLDFLEGEARLQFSNSSPLLRYSIFYCSWTFMLTSYQANTHINGNQDLKDVKLWQVILFMLYCLMFSFRFSPWILI